VRHARTLTYTAPDPATGVRYPIPAGGADDDGADQGADTGDQGEGSGDGQDDQGDEQGEADGGEQGEEDGGHPAGSAEALRADLARERKRRQAAERAIRERDQEHETDADRIRREAREEILEPVRARARRDAVRDAAVAAGFEDPADAYAFLRETVADLEVDDDTLDLVDPAEVADAVDALARRKPKLLTEAARARLEGRSSSGTTRSSVDASGGATDTDQGTRADDAFARILSGRK
jgi:hypothetical protein